MTGFRIAYGCAQKHFGVTPDVTTLGKVIGGGLPVGAYGGRKDIMELVSPAGPMYQAGTLSGNPLAMAAGIKTLEILRRPGSYEYLEKITSTLIKGILDAGKFFCYIIVQLIFVHHRRRSSSWSCRNRWINWCNVWILL